jgi:hypothetical protein
MTLSWEDHVAINELIALHGHLCDSGELDRLGEVFTADVAYDVSDFGSGVLHGLAANRDAALALGDRNPVGHHVTNVILTEQSPGLVHAKSKGIGITANGTCGSVTYDDTVVRLEHGWRISARIVRMRRAPLGG